MAEHQTVAQLQQWLEDQKNPPLTRADKIVRWFTQNIPGAQKIISHDFFRTSLLFISLPLMAVPFFPLLSDNNAVYVFCMVALAPPILSWCAGLNWIESFANYTPAKKWQIDDLRKKLHRVHTYHPELQSTLDRVSSVLDHTPSEGTANKLETLLNDVVLQLPVRVAKEVVNDEHKEQRNNNMWGEIQ